MEKEGNMITDWLDKNGDPEIEKKVEKELRTLRADFALYKQFTKEFLDRQKALRGGNLFIYK